VPEAGRLITSIIRAGEVPPRLRTRPEAACGRHIQGSAGARMAVRKPRVYTVDNHAGPVAV